MGAQSELYLFIFHLDSDFCQTFGDPKHRQATAGNNTGFDPVNQQQGYGTAGAPAQQGFTNPGAGSAYPPPTHPPTGY